MRHVHTHSLNHYFSALEECYFSFVWKWIFFYFDIEDEEIYGCCSVKLRKPIINSMKITWMIKEVFFINEDVPMAFTPNILRKCQLMTTKSNKTKNCWSFRLTYNQYLFLAFNLSIFLLYQPLRLIRLIYWLQLNKEEARLMRRHTHTIFIYEFMSRINLSISDENA